MKKKAMFIALVLLLSVLTALAACVDTSPSEPEQPERPEPSEPIEPAEPVEPPGGIFLWRDRARHLSLRRHGDGQTRDDRFARGL